MSITDELRKWASIEVPYKYGHQLNAIADRIDAEHEREMQRMWDEADGFDEAVFESTHIELPKDANGVPIHVGDSMQVIDGDGHWCGPFMVLHMVLLGSEWRIVLDAGTYAPEKCRHYVSDTWERIISDAIVLGVEQQEGEVGLDAYCNQCEALVARCKVLAKEYE